MVACKSFFFNTVGRSAAAHVPNMFTITESWALHTEAVTTFPKSHIIECFFNMVEISKHLGLAFKTRPLPAVGSGIRREKKTSQVKFKDVFLLETRLHCHKPRETFSCSTFFMVSLRVSSLPFSLHLGSRVTNCCTGCRPLPAGDRGEARSSSPQLSSLSLDGSHGGESTTWTGPPKPSFTTLLK